MGFGEDEKAMALINEALDELAIFLVDDVGVETLGLVKDLGFDADASAKGGGFFNKGRGERAEVGDGGDGFVLGIVGIGEDEGGEGVGGFFLELAVELGEELMGKAIVGVEEDEPRGTGATGAEVSLVGDVSFF